MSRETCRLTSCMFALARQFALTEIKGVGRRYSNLVCKKADVDLNKRLVVTLRLRGSR